MRYLIVCGGKIDKEFGLNEIKTDGIDAIIAADSGMDFLYENGVTPDIIVGDFDSATTKSLEYFERKGQTEIHRLNPIKDDTDTEYAIRLAIREGARSIVLLGATGSRIDHVLGNISLLGIGLESGTDISIIDTNNRIRMADRPITIEKSAQYGRFVSLIAIEENLSLLSQKIDFLGIWDYYIFRIISENMYGHTVKTGEKGHYAFF